MIRTNNKVALYARYSSDNQRAESIDAQIRAMKAYCKQHSFVIVESYIDEAKSATTDNRPSFQRMIADSANHTFNIVLVHKLDRFARNRYDSAVYKRELKKNGVQVYSVLENLDDSPESIMLEAVLEGMSEYFSENLARETMKGLKETALQCKHTGGMPPLGYDVDEATKKLVINSHEAETVKLIFDMYADGNGYSPILDELHRRNLKTKNGNEFNKISLYSILTNPKYQGLYVFNRSSAKSITGTRNTHLLKDAEDIICIDGGCPQIVDKDTYDKVQKRITEHKHTGGRLNAKENYLLSGKVFCKECGRSMVGNTRYSGRNKQLYITYRCPSKRYACSNKEINKVYLEDYVIMLLEKHIFNSYALKKLIKNIEKRIENADVTDNSYIYDELDKVNEALKNVADAVANGLISDVLIDRLKELEQKKTSLEARLNDSKADTEYTKIDANLILSDYNNIRNTPALPAYKDFIKSFIARIDVGKYSVDVTLKTGLDVCDALNNTYEVRRQTIYERKSS